MIPDIELRSLTGLHAQTSVLSEMGLINHLLVIFHMRLHCRMVLLWEKDLAAVPHIVWWCLPSQDVWFLELGWLLVTECAR